MWCKIKKEGEFVIKLNLLFRLLTVLIIIGVVPIQAVALDDAININDIDTEYNLVYNKLDMQSEEEINTVAKKSSRDELGLIYVPPVPYEPTEEEIAGVRERMANPSMLSTPAINSTRKFQKLWISPISQTFTGTLVAISNKYLIYIESKYNTAYYNDLIRRFFPSGTNQSAAATAYAKQLDTHLAFLTNSLTTNRQYFGQPIDIDGNGRTILFFCEMKGPEYAGVYYPANIYNFNEADMLYINPLIIVNEYVDTVAHETSHLIMDSYKLSNAGLEPELWLHESMAMLAGHIANINVEGADAPLYINPMPYIGEYGSGPTYIPNAYEDDDYDYVNIVYSGGLTQAIHYWKHMGTNQTNPINRVMSDKRGADETIRRIGDNYLRNKGKTVTSNGYNQFFNDYILAMALDSKFTDNGVVYDYTAPDKDVWENRFASNNGYKMSAVDLSYTGTRDLSTGTTSFRPDLKLFKKTGGSQVDFKITENQTGMKYNNKYYIVYPEEMNIDSNVKWINSTKKFKELQTNTNYSYEDGGRNSYFAILAVGHDKPVRAGFAVSGISTPEQIEILSLDDTISKKNNQLSGRIDIGIEYQGNAGRRADVMGAVYDPSGRLVYLGAEFNTMLELNDYGYINTYNFDVGMIPNCPDGNYTVKIYVWDPVNELTPLTDSYDDKYNLVG